LSCSSSRRLTSQWDPTNRVPLALQDSECLHILVERFNMNRSARPAYKHNLLYLPPFDLTDRLDRPVFAARIVLDTAIPVLATPHALPSTGFSFPPLSLLPTIRPSSRIAYTVLDPRVYPTCFLSQSRMHALCTAVTTSFCPRHPAL
jgi:hypothetical protein